MSMPILALPALDCPIFLPEHAEYETELAVFHLNVRHTPHMVVVAHTAADVAEAVRFAQRQLWPISVLGGGHGVGAIDQGVVLSTRRLNQVSIDPARKTATFGAGVRWSEVIEAAAPFGLMPVVGSTSHVGAIGFLTGGGLSPIGRSHGYGSDYVERFELVIGSGEIVEASTDQNPDLFWALRGGKSGFGIITEATIHLVSLSCLYAGNMIFEEIHIETVVRGWLDWTTTADAQVTTSIMTIDFPDIEIAPPPFRGKRLLFLRFAYPGDPGRGAELAAPLRALAPAMIDGVGLIPCTDMDSIHTDPTDPLPAWEAGAQYGSIDQDWIERWLEHFGPGKRSPLAAVEIRHGGARLKVDVAEGSAVGGRDAEYTLFMMSLYPPLFEEVAPATAHAVLGQLQAWELPETNVNFIGHRTGATAWNPETQARLDTLRQQVDPEGVFTVRW